MAGGRSWCVLLDEEESRCVGVAPVFLGYAPGTAGTPAVKVISHARLFAYRAIWDEKNRRS
jgi:hypothetical protein